MGVRRLFLSVGAMKAGTTFLFNVFNRHPEIYFTPEKELHYFAHAYGMSLKLQMPIVSPYSLDGLLGVIRRAPILSTDFRRHRLGQVMRGRFSNLQDAEQLRDLVQWYADRYLANPVDDAWFDRVFEGVGDRYAADFSNYHALLSRKAWQQVKKSTDELKVIYVMREPVSRMWSHIKFHYIQAGRRRELDCLGLDDIDRILKTSYISAHARYGDIVKSLQENLSESQLKIVFLEDFIENFPKSIKEIEYFLSVNNHDFREIDPGKKSNPTDMLDMPSGVFDMIKAATDPQLEKLARIGIKVPESYHNVR